MPISLNPLTAKPTSGLDALQIPQHIFAVSHGDFSLRAGYVYLGQYQVVGGTSSDGKLWRRHGYPPLLPRLVEIVEARLRFRACGHAPGSLLGSLNCSVERFGFQGKKYNVRSTGSPGVQRDIQVVVLADQNDRNRR